MIQRPSSASPLLVAVLVAVAGGALAKGGEVRTWETTSDFRPGELDHVALTPHGQLVLSPAYDKLSEFDEPVAWSVALGKDGAAYVGTGHEGRVWTVNEQAETSLYFDSPELEVLAVAMSPRRAGTLYAATSPDGKVYGLTGPEQSAVFFDPPERYIWDLSFDAQGNLLVATGDPASIYRVDRGGNADKLLSADATHILSVISHEGVVYAGSGGDGYLYRIGRDGLASVLLDTEHAELRGLVVDADGTLWIAATGHRAGDGPPQQQQPAPPPNAQQAPPRSNKEQLAEFNQAVEVHSDTTQEGSQPGAAEQAPVALPASGPKTTTIYRIEQGQHPVVYWRTGSATGYDLAIFRGRPTLATGDEGRLALLDERGRATVLIDVPAGQLTSLAQSAGRHVMAASNLSALYSFSDESAESGSYTSEVLDSSSYASWGRLSVAGTGSITVETRSGNTRRPDSMWSDWSASEGDILSPPARYLQYRLTLEAGATEPLVETVKLAYLATNRVPRIAEVEVLGPHAELRSSGAGGGRPSALRSMLAAKPGAESGGQPLPPPPEQETYGMRAARWQAQDPDSDTLEFKIEYRGIDERVFRTMAERHPESFISWDETALADGRYVLRVTADDRASNAPERAKQTSLESQPFLVDRTPPAVKSVKQSVASTGSRVRFELSDTTSNIVSAHYSVDGQDWLNALPEDQVFDETREHVNVVLGSLASGEHTVVLRASDEARNVGAGNVVLQVGRRTAQPRDIP